MSRTREKMGGACEAGGQTSNHWARVVAIMLIVPAMGHAQAVPKWVSPAHMLTRDGRATLQWSIEGSEPAPVFRIRERSRAEQQVLFTDQAEYHLFRQSPGDYCFWVQTCVYQPDGYPSCSPPSAPLSLTVLAEDKGMNPAPVREHSPVLACEPTVLRNVLPAAVKAARAVEEWSSGLVRVQGDES